MLLKTLPLDNDTPVQYVCFHPIAAAHLQNGETINEFTGEKYEPSCMAVDYEYESILQELCVALGWQGGTINQAIAEVKRLKAAGNQGVTDLQPTTNEAQNGEAIK